MTILKHHRENLEKLRDYLRSLPEDYKHFDMDTYLDVPVPNIDFEDSMLSAAEYHNMYFNQKCSLKDLGPCGAVACAVGHGPAAGIPFNVFSPIEDSNPYQNDPWGTYAYENFITYYSQYLYLFSDAWADFEPGHYDAANRIDNYLKADGNIDNYTLPWED